MEEVLTTMSVTPGPNQALFSELAAKCDASISKLKKAADAEETREENAGDADATVAGGGSIVGNG